MNFRLNFDLGLDEDVSTFPKWPAESASMLYAHNILASVFRSFQSAFWTLPAIIFSPVLELNRKAPYSKLDLDRARCHFNGKGIERGIDWEATLKTIVSQIP